MDAALASSATADERAPGFKEHTVAASLISRMDNSCQAQTPLPADRRCPPLRARLRRPEASPPSVVRLHRLRARFQVTMLAGTPQKVHDARYANPVTHRGNPGLMRRRVTSGQSGHTPCTVSGLTSSPFPSRPSGRASSNASADRSSPTQPCRAMITPVDPDYLVFKYEIRA